jgi:tripartite-type tricarboxylate transporter receptor subunit TctC
MRLQVWRSVAFAACSLLPALGYAQAPDFPNRPVRIVVPSAPTGILDTVARLLAPKMTEGLGQNVVVENRPGAGTNIGTEIVARAPGDGYTLLVQTNPLAVNPALYPKLPFDVQRDFAPVSLVISGAPYLLIVHPSVPVKSVKELVALAKAKPGALNYSSGGYGTNIQTMGELFKYLSRTDMLHVPYKGGGGALTALLSGETGVTFFALGAILPLVKDGRVRALATTGSKRAMVLPALPTIAEAGVPGYEFTSWVGLLVPGTTPPPIVSILHGHIAKAARTSGLAERLANEGAEVGATSPEQFRTHLKTETTRWSKVIKAIGMRAE